jgi:hypothetical protein
VIDAITSAHLKNFDISRDISLRVRPLATPQGVGFGLVMSFNPKPLLMNDRDLIPGLPLNMQ